MHPVQGRTFNSPTPNHSMSHPSGNASHTWASICETTPPRRGLPFRTTVFILRFPTLVSVIYFQYVPEIPAAAPPSVRPLRQTFSRLHTTRTIVPHRALFRVAAPRDRAGRATSDSGEAPSSQETPPTAAHRLPQPEGTRNTLFSLGSSGTVPPPTTNRAFGPLAARRKADRRRTGKPFARRKPRLRVPDGPNGRLPGSEINRPPFIYARPRSVRTLRNPPFPPQG